MFVAWSGLFDAGEFRTPWRPRVVRTTAELAVILPSAPSVPRVTSFESPDIAVVSIAPPWGPDAHALAAAYARHGHALASRVDGEFSTVVLDARSCTLLATSALTARLPIAFARAAGGLIVSSHVLELLRHPGVGRSLDETYLSHIVTGLGYPPPGTTAIQGIRRLCAGEALVVTNGRDRVIKADRFVARPGRFSSFAECKDAFWQVATASAERRIARADRACISISGGLDSAVVALSSADALSRLALFSTVAAGRPDESEALGDLEDTLGARATRVECADAVSCDVLEDLPLRDDPVFAALSRVETNVRLAKAMRDSGYATVFEGEGGDEIFALNVSPLQAVRRGDWRSAASYILSQRARRWVVWRSLILPHAPAHARHLVYARWARRWNPLPGYIARRRATDPKMRDTLDQYYDVLVHRDLDQALALWLSTPIFLGARIAHERTFAAFGLQVAAPLVDRGLIEFVLSIPARFMISPQFDKAFLRRALEGRVSEPFRLRPKDLRLVLDMAPDVLLTEATRRVLADVRVRRRLAQWVRFDVVEELIERLRRGYRPSLRVLWPLECLVAFAQWYARAASEYGVD